MTRRVVVAGWTGSRNLGDELLLRALLHHLDGRAEVTAVSIDPTGTRRRHGVEAVSDTDVAGFGRALRRADVAVFGPGGLIHDSSSSLSLVRMSGRAVLARALSSATVGVGLGVAPLRRPVNRRLVRAALGGVPLCVRDAESADLLVDMGLPRPQVAADLVFTLPPVTVPPAERIVVSCRPNLATRLLGHRGVDPTGTIQVAHARTIAEALDRLAAALDLPVALVAMEGGRDDAFGAAVAEAMRAPAVSVVPDLDDVREEVASAALVVAGRYHAGICALAAGRPLVLVGSTSKVGNLHRAASSDGVGLIADDATGWAGLVDAARRALDGAPTVPAARDRLVAAAAGAFDVLDAALA